MATQGQLTLPSGEPRYTKVKGEQRYYDHKLGKTISHRQYWNARKAAAGTQAKQSTWTPEKQAKLKAPPAIQAPPVVKAGPNLLAQQLLAESSLDSMAGSPIVETPPAPQMARQLAEDIAEDTKKSIGNLADTFAPILAALLILVGLWLVPEYMRWLVPDQEEAELVFNPALRIMFRYLGISGKALGPDGSDLMSLVMALGAYAIGATERLQDYLESVEETAEDEPADTASAYARASSRDRGRQPPGGAYPAQTPYAGSASPPAPAPVPARDRQQSNPAASQQISASGARPSIQVTTERQARDASKIRELYDMDYQGRVRLGLAR